MDKPLLYVREIGQVKYSKQDSLSSQGKNDIISRIGRVGRVSL